MRPACGPTNSQRDPPLYTLGENRTLRCRGVSRCAETRLRIRLLDHLRRRFSASARQFHVSFYDAAYLDERLPLATLERRLYTAAAGRHAPDCQVPLIDVTAILLSPLCGCPQQACESDRPRREVNGQPAPKFRVSRVTSRLLRPVLTFPC